MSPFDLRRSVDLVLERSVFDAPFEWIEHRHVGPPGHGAYYVAASVDGPAGLLFACPACSRVCSIAFHNFDGHPAWSWNGDQAKPTTTPSIVHSEASCGWHGYLTAGRFVSL